MTDVRALFMDGPWGADGTERWVDSPPPEKIVTPGGSTYSLVDADEKLAIYQDDAFG